MPQMLKSPTADSSIFSVPSWKQIKPWRRKSRECRRFKASRVGFDWAQPKSSCSHLPRTLDNAGRRSRAKRGDAVHSAFPKGKKHDKIFLIHWSSPFVISINGRQFHRNHCLYCFYNPLGMFFMQHQGKQESRGWPHVLKSINLRDVAQLSHFCFISILKMSFPITSNRFLLSLRLLTLCVLSPTNRDFRFATTGKPANCPALSCWHASQNCFRSLLIKRY